MKETEEVEEEGKGEGGREEEGGEVKEKDDDEDNGEVYLCAVHAAVVRLSVCPSVCSSVCPSDVCRVEEQIVKADAICNGRLTVAYHRLNL